MGSAMSFVRDNIRSELLVLVWASHFWEFYLCLRQRKVLQTLVDVPSSLDGLMSKEIYDKSRAYALHGNGWRIVKDFFSTSLNSIFLTTYAFWYFWRWGDQLLNLVGLDAGNEILQSGATMLCFSSISTVISLPFTIYEVFFLEEKFGFNKQNPWFFVKDQLLKFVVFQGISVPLTCGLIWIIKNGGDYFLFYVWLFTVVVALFMMMIYPEVIAPLFDKYSPLPEGELRRRIEALAQSVEFPLYKLYIVEGSKRSSHSNAYMYGFYKNKRIVLFDTLVKEYYKPEEGNENKSYGCENDEVVAVLAHELGHWKYNHTVKGILLSQVSFVLNFSIFSKLMDYKPLYAAFGFEHSQPILIGMIIIFMYTLIPLNTLLGLVGTIITRRHEFQADGFAKKLGYTEPLKRALIKLHKDNLGFPIFDKLYSGFFHSHPPLLERLAAMDKCE